MTEVVRRRPNRSTTIETFSVAVAVLVLSRALEDYDLLRRVLCGSKWSLYDASDVPSGLQQLRRHKNISLIVCDRESWKEMVASTAQMPDAPLIIVAAAERGWL